MPNEANRNVLRTREILIERFGGKCWFENCEEDDPTKLEFAHIFPTRLKGRGRGRKERIYDVSKNPDCYALVCSYHNGQIDEVLEAIDLGRETLGLPYIFLKKEVK
jgi:hypothetical protein